MSQELLSQKMKRTCDGCGYVKEYEMVSATEEEILDLASWYAVGRKAFVGGRPVQLTMEAHTLECIPAAAVKLLAQIPKEEEQPEIDLASLRQAGNTLN